jgi:nucleotide-binding universal stress UspA family protein
MAMPPMLKWALKRLPMGPEEKARLEREEFEAQGFIKHIERLLVAVDDSPSGELASRLAGLLAGVRQMPTTVLHFDAAPGGGQGSAADEKAATQHTAAIIKAGGEADITARSEKPNTSADAIVEEAKKGYGLLVIGREPASEGNSFDSQITRSAVGFGGPFAIAIARRADAKMHAQDAGGGKLNILVPITGTSISRDGAELAIALAQACQGSVTALYVTNPARQARAWRLEFGAVLGPENTADAAIREIVELGEHYGIEVRGAVRRGRATENAILKEIEAGQHTLLVMGVSPRPGEQLFFGDVPAELLERAACSILFVSSEHR